jgi:flagellar motility protein MotE (MotC chaperone)
MAVPLVFKSCLIEKAFDTGLEERFKFKEEKEKLDQERKQKESEFETRLKELQESNEDTAALEADWETEKEGWQELNEPEFESIKKEYVICFDTMGKDREISP